MSRYGGVITLCPVLNGVVGMHEDVPHVPAVCPQEWILIISVRIASVDYLVKPVIQKHKQTVSRYF